MRSLSTGGMDESTSTNTISSCRRSVKKSLVNLSHDMREVVLALAYPYLRRVSE